VSEALDDSLKSLNPEELAETERVEAELDQFVERRARQSKDKRAVEELWAKSVREYRAKHRDENAQAWYSYHNTQIRNHESNLGFLVRYHQKESARYARVLGISGPLEEAGLYESLGNLGSVAIDSRAAGLVGSDGGSVVGSMICSVCLLPPSQRREIDRMLFLERRETFSEVARRSKMSRKNIQKHYRHYVEELLAQEPSASTPTTSTVVYAPIINNLVVLSEDGPVEASEPEGDEPEESAKVGGGGVDA
jgi:hypothetical protein